MSAHCVEVRCRMTRDGKQEKERKWSVESAKELSTFKDNVWKKAKTVYGFTFDSRVKATASFDLALPDGSVQNDALTDDALWKSVVEGMTYTYPTNTTGYYVTVHVKTVITGSSKLLEALVSLSCCPFQYPLAHRLPLSPGWRETQNRPR
jgi:hypothetical protein